MKPNSIVIDTNVLVSALRSKKGASYRLLRLVDKGLFQINISVPLIFEYEAAAKKRGTIPSRAVDAVVDYLCAIGVHRKTHFLWRPMLRDPKDDMVLELAIASGRATVVTYNKQDFVKASMFGIDILTPQELLEQIGGNL